MDKKLMKYIPKEYKAEVEDIYWGEKDFDDVVMERWYTPLVVEWKDGEVSRYASGAYARFKLKEFGR